MSFDDLRLNWQGKDYVIPARGMLEAVARVEDIITFHELLGYSERKTAPVGKISQAYGSLLRYAGVTISDDEVYSGMFGDLADGAGDSALSAIQTLMMMMVPKDRKTTLTEGGAAKVPGKSSKPRGKRSLAQAGSRRKNSGS